MLTVAVPTYARPAKLRELLRALYGDLPKWVSAVFVIDDGPSDATAAVAAEFAGKKGFRFQQNATNQGYSETMARLFDACETPYLMMMADDDLVATENIDRLMGEFGTTAISFASPIYELEGRRYRGQTVTEFIKPTKLFNVASHASGLIYRVPDFQPHVARLRQMLADRRAAAVFYPQLVLLSLVMLGGKLATFAPHVSARDNDNLASDLRDHHGGGYASFEARVEQLADWSRFFGEAEIGPSELRALMKRAFRQTWLELALVSWGVDDADGLAAAQRWVARALVRRLGRQALGR